MENKSAVQQGRPMPQDDLDTEGNRFMRKAADEPGPEGDLKVTPDEEQDTEGNRYMRKATEEPGPEGDLKVTPEDDQDTEGHKTYARSDRDVKADIEPVSWGESDEAEADTEAHGRRLGEPAAAAPADERATAPGPDDDTEGHKIYSRSDRNVKRDITPVAWDLR